ncbi:helix-turn-helix domain-containing protein [Roseimicrobium sp. ORNL1]|uniref:winged helix-turn-helix transcriptional regulator n=1 Tax=Roseimicrobium sp. ORNL1 TaxID=2711231 RepID=UPI0013E1756F|nr:helix-turn-helix domain-containing protein [Roseimicrobium sp. ORNL1]QIF05464.1 helix-turn-helix transcriptional regulator [Roseimicrobium sp. ORNL1]
MKPLSYYEQKHDRLADDCPVRAALDVIRGRWKPSILFELKTGRKRFSDIQSALPEVTAQALTVQLRQLEADGIVNRKVYAEVPQRVEYSLSKHGRALSNVMDALEKWGMEHQERERQAEAGAAAS